MRARSIMALAALVSSIAPAFAREQPPSPAPSSDSAAATFIPWLLQGKEELTAMPFRDVIFHATGKQVRPLDRNDEADQRVLKQIGAALDEVLKRMNAPTSPVQTGARINEVSGPFENMVLELLNAMSGLRCEFPKTAAERAQRSGYPTCASWMRRRSASTTWTRSFTQRRVATAVSARFTSNRKLRRTRCGRTRCT